MKGIIKVTLLAFCLLPQLGLAQEQLSREEQADRQYNRYEYYFASINYLKLTERKNDVKTIVLERLANCYRQMNNYLMAEQWFAKAVERADMSPLSNLYYGEMLQTNYKFDLAKKQYEIYGQKAGVVTKMAIKIASCNAAQQWLGEKNNNTVSNVRSLNSKGSDWGLSYYEKNGLVFTSERDSVNQKNKNKYGWNGMLWTQLFVADDEAQNVNPIDIISDKYGIRNNYHIGPMELNATEDTAYVTVTTSVSPKNISSDENNKARLFTRRLQLLQVTKKENKWAEVKEFPYNNIDKYSIGHAALNAKGDIIYFSSDMTGGVGGNDIWYSEKQNDGTWAAPKNCGKSINTTEDEAFPRIGNDEQLYYSSKGKVGMGGYDIFVSKGKKDNWTEAENLKSPINSTSDDFYLTTKDGITGYLSSNREAGVGSDDIYSFNRPKAPVILAVRAGIVESDTLQRSLELTKKNDTYGDLRKGKTFVLEGIHYDLDKANVRPDAAQILNKLVAILKENPTVKIELSSHTDSRSSAQYNLQLSERRAVSAVKYLIAKGISANRLVAKGYGESKLITPCRDGVKCSEEQYQQDRRTEIKVL